MNPLKILFICLIGMDVLGMDPAHKEDPQSRSHRVSLWDATTRNDQFSVQNILRAEQFLDPWQIGASLIYVAANHSWGLARLILTSSHPINQHFLSGALLAVGLPQDIQILIQRRISPPSFTASFGWIRRTVPNRKDW